MLVERAKTVSQQSCPKFQNISPTCQIQVSFTYHLLFYHLSFLLFLLKSVVEVVNLDSSSSENDEITIFDPKYDYEKLVRDGEYNSWLTNVPYLYSSVTKSQLEWPSYTCQWLPRVTDLDNDHDENHEIHPLLIGTSNNKSNINNYLIVQHCYLPKSSTYPDGEGSVVEALAAEDHKCEEFLKIPHEGPVYRARYMPNKPDIVATKSDFSQVLIFDLAENLMPSGKESANKCKPSKRLTGHRMGGFALSWNKNDLGHLLSGSKDGSICCYDVNSNSSDAISTFDRHLSAVNDIEWDPFSENVFRSVGDDCKLINWDARTGKTMAIVDAHSMPIHSLVHNPAGQHLFFTGSEDELISLWDDRILKNKVHSFIMHKGTVNHLEFSPHNDFTFASSSHDRRLIIWDMSLAGSPQSDVDAAEGPPECAFIHGGHQDVINDFAFNQYIPGLIASLDRAGVLYIWARLNHHAK